MSNGTSKGGEPPKMAPGSQVYEPDQQSAALATRETAGSALAAHAEAMVKARYAIALRNPRDWDVVRERLLKECQRPGFADSAWYKKPIGAGVEGLSIRFVEASLRCMGNVTVDTLTVYDDDEKRIVRVEVGDLETNLPYGRSVTVSKTVERKKIQPGDEVLRKRTNSKGEPVFILRGSDDDILNKENALISKAIRTLGLRLLPGDLQDECTEIIKATNKKRDAADPDAAKKKLFDGFGTVGVSVEQIKEYLGHDGKTLNPAELTELRALYTAIRDGEATWREAMENKEKPTPPRTEPPAASTPAPQAKAEAMPQAVPAGPPPGTEAGPSEPKKEDWKERLAKAAARARET